MTGLRTWTLTLVLWVLVASCTGQPAVDPTAIRGVVLPDPIPRPDFTLNNTDGSPYHFANETNGRLTFLFFGYTHCPDVCPVHMANLASAIHRLEYEDREKISVVFVTVDPRRDTPGVLKSWIESFDPAFVALGGGIAESEVDSIQTSLKLGLPIREPARPDGSYAVGHAGQIIVFQADDTARIVYPFGTRQIDWVNDLPRLLDPQYRPVKNQ